MESHQTSVPFLLPDPRAIASLTTVIDFLHSPSQHPFVPLESKGILICLSEPVLEKLLTGELIGSGEVTLSDCLLFERSSKVVKSLSTRVGEVVLALDIFVGETGEVGRTPNVVLMGEGDRGRVMSPRWGKFACRRSRGPKSLL